MHTFKRSVITVAACVLYEMQYAHSLCCCMSLLLFSYNLHQCHCCKKYYLLVSSRFIEATVGGINLMVTLATGRVLQTYIHKSDMI